jgi:excisionase family DNA binding protein
MSKAMVDSEEKYLTIDDLSEFLQIPKATLYKYTAKNTSKQRLVGVRIGRSLRFRKSDVNDWLEKCKDT